MKKKIFIVAATFIMAIQFSNTSHTGTVAHCDNEFYQKLKAREQKAPSFFNKLSQNLKNFYQQIHFSIGAGRDEEEPKDFKPIKVSDIKKGITYVTKVPIIIGKDIYNFFSFIEKPYKDIGEI